MEISRFGRWGVSEPFDKPIWSLYGVGEVRAAAYNKAGVYRILDLLYYFPRAYENRGEIKLLAETCRDKKSAVMLTVATEPRGARVRRGMSLFKFRAYDESGTCVITYFNQDYLRDKFKPGSTYRFWGKVERAGRGYAMSSPAFEPYVEGLPLPGLVPVYRLAEGLAPKQVIRDIKTALSYAADKLLDWLPEEIREEKQLCTLAYALRNIHEPESYAALAVAKRRLVFDELFMYSLGLVLAGKRQRSGGAVPCKSNDISKLIRMLPFRLTNAQLRVINEIRADMERDIPMRRIIVGDVGCGKTICAAAAMLIAVQSGRQAALMAPTEILARQHFDDLAPLFAQLGIGCELLVGATPQAKKHRIYEALALTEPALRLDIVIGTHALLSEGVEFAAEGLIVTDEQQRFGVNQRAALSRKNEQAHVLVMSATPIPRSMALVMYGDLDISKIDQMPPGRQRVDTFVVDESYRARVDAFIKKLTGEGGQVYIVCPAIEEAEVGDNEISLSDITLSDLGRAAETQPPLKAVEVYAKELAGRLPGVKIELLHGKLKAAEKERIMQSFAAGEIQVLVSTTVIEVGVNVPNACLMIVENAERFGLSQLHQLRGRVGRGGRKSYCILISDATGEAARARLETIRTTYDGYLIAEADLRLRGPGDFFGGAGAVRQSGGLRFRLADLCDDIGLLNSAMEAARALVGRDPALDSCPGLRAEVDRMFSDAISEIS
ncbi:MAG TPA: ATP-dependent DNA helicase RecG [Clostridiales bacterium]|nr:ATP-dependent DNA helicase RecG [Clostridiales bacterium]